MAVPMAEQSRAADTAVSPAPRLPSSLPSLPWIRALREALVFWLGTRVVYALITWVAALFGDAAVSQTTPAVAIPPDQLLMHWWFWDAAFYAHIASQGYDITGTQRFFPLYPALIHLIAQPFGLTSGVALLAISMSLSSLATLAALYGLVLLARHEGLWHPTPRLVMYGLAAFPLAFFLFAGYADALFLALAVWALLAARRRWWYLAALCGMLAALCRPTGLALGLPLVWEYGHTWWAGRAFPRDDKAWLRRMRCAGEAVAAILAVPLGIGIWSVYCWRQWGDPLIWLHTQQSASGRVLLPPWEGIWLAIQQLAALPAWSYEQARAMIDVLPLLWLILACIWLALPLRLRLGRWISITRPAQPAIYTLYLAGLLALFTMAPMVHDRLPDMLAGDGRYVLAAVPLWLATGHWLARHRQVEGWLLIAGWVLQALFVAFEFAHGALV